MHLPRCVARDFIRAAFVCAGAFGAVALAASARMLAAQSLPPAAQCVPLEQPRNMPAMSALLDSAGLVNRLAGLGGASASDVIVSVRPGAFARASLVSDTSPSAERDSVRALVLGAARADGKDFPASYRVRIAGGAQRTLSIERSALCAALTEIGSAPRGARLGSVEFRAAPGSALSATNPPRQIDPRIKIDGTGMVIDVTLGSGSGVADVDRSLREMLLAQRYTPATLDGHPVSVWTFRGKTELIR